MSTTVLTVEQLTVNTRGADFADVSTQLGKGTVATTPTDGWVITPPSGQQFDERLVLCISADASGDTITFLAGTRYPAQRADLGNLSIVLAASDTRFLSIETARFMRSDGTILATAVDAGTAIVGAMLPKGP